MQIDEESAKTVLRRYRNSLRSGAGQTYVRIAEKFIEYVLRRQQGTLDRNTVSLYIKKAINDKYAPGTISKVMIPTIHKLFRVNDIEWDVREGELISFSEADEYTPALSPIVVKKFIAAAKTPRVNRYAAAFLALSTTYGVRRVEMAEIDRSQVDIEHGCITIDTAKRGRKRTHLIPDEIKPYLDIPWHPHNLTYVTEAYKDIESAAGVKRMKEVGWHAIRRILVRLLADARVPEMHIINFMRWKRTAHGMLGMYFSTTVVDEEGSHSYADRFDTEVDEAIFAVHPFIKEWA